MSTSKNKIDIILEGEIIRSQRQVQNQPMKKQKTFFIGIYKKNENKIHRLCSNEFKNLSVRSVAHCEKLSSYLYLIRICLKCVNANNLLKPISNKCSKKHCGYKTGNSDCVATFVENITPFYI